MTIIVIMILGSMIVFGASAVYALYWSAKNGQFENLDSAAETIFGADEPVGKPTDSFPNRRLPQAEPAPKDT